MERATTTTAANTRARPLRLHDADPGPALEAAFLRIEREAMDGLPLLIKALRVQAVGFERWQGQDATVTRTLYDRVIADMAGCFSNSSSTRSRASMRSQAQAGM